jgi:signal transduction histidine kinase
MSKPIADNLELTEELRQELALFEQLKPFLGRCLTLNHDLNNPLAGVIGYTEFLQEEADQLSDEHREFVDQIMQCAERMKRVLDVLGEEKIVLGKKIDLGEVTAAYNPKTESSD